MRSSCAAGTVVTAIHSGATVPIHGGAPALGSVLELAVLVCRLPVVLELEVCERLLQELWLVPVLEAEGVANQTEALGFLDVPVVLAAGVSSRRNAG